MPSRTSILKCGTPLARALPAAQFAERHSRVLDAAPEQVWDVLHAVRWRDLTLTKPLVWVRLGPSLQRGRSRMVDVGPGAPIHEDPPRTMSSGFVARPWKPVPEMGPAMPDLDALQAFAEPGWLKVGMEWVLSPVAGGRTLVETTTLCEATDDVARRRFAAYWLVVRPFSGLVRRDLLHVLARAVRDPAAA
jgi:hypothetical protein